MRVAFYGNTANNFTEVVESLREWTDVEAFLLIDDTTTIYTDPGLRGNVQNGQQEWTIRGRWLSSLWIRRSPVIRWLRRNGIDVFVTSDMGPRVLPYVRSLRVFAPIGFDLTYMPVKRYSREYRALIRQALADLVRLHVGSSLRQLGWARLRSAQERGIRAADVLLVVKWEPFSRSLESMEVAPGPDRRITVGRSWIPIDTGLFSQKAYADLSPAAATLRREGRFILFHPSRLMFTRNDVLVASGQFKANDVLIRGFSLFLQQLPDADKKSVLMVMPERPPSHSPDIEAAKELVEDLGLSENVQWLAPQHDPTGFTRGEMVDLYSACDVVGDAFAEPGIGSTTLEALAMGKPLLLSVDHEAEAMHYGGPFPGIDVRTPEQVADALHSLFSDAALRHEIGLAGRTWVDEFHGHQASAQFWTKLLESWTTTIPSPVGAKPLLNTE